MFEDVSRCTTDPNGPVLTRTDHPGPFISVGPYRYGLPPNERICADENWRPEGEY